MPLTSRSGESSGGFETPQADAGSMQVVIQDYPVPPPTSLSASATWNSGLMMGDGYPKICVGVASDHAGTLIIHRYVDLPGTIERTAVTTPIVGGTPLVVDVVDGLPYIWFAVEIDNAAGATGNISKFSVLLTN